MTLLVSLALLIFNYFILLIKPLKLRNRTTLAEIKKGVEAVFTFIPDLPRLFRT